MALQGNVDVSSAASLTLSPAYSIYTYVGSAVATWTMPSVSGTSGQILLLFNRGTSAVTVTRAGTDNLYWRGATATTVSLYPGSAIEFVNDGTYWLGIPRYLASPAFDGVALYTAKQRNSGTPANSGVPFTWSHTVTKPSYGIVALVSDGIQPSDMQPASVTGYSVSLGGVALTSLGYAGFNGTTSDGWGWVFGAPGIPTGAQTASVTLTKSGSTFNGIALSYTYSGVSQVSPLGITTGAANFLTGTITPITAAPSLVWGLLAADEDIQSFGMAHTRSFLDATSSLPQYSFYTGDQYTASTDPFNVNGFYNGYAGGTADYAVFALNFA